MRFVISALLALALGLLPAATARAQIAAAAPAATMSCDDMSAMGHHMDAGRGAPARDMEACAEHCLSQVNAQPTFARSSAPSLQNVIAAPLVDAGCTSKPRLRDAPDPPPPRI